jgi:hypothetical protein
MPSPKAVVIPSEARNLLFSRLKAKQIPRCARNDNAFEGSAAVSSKLRNSEVVRHLLGETLQQLTVASHGLLEGIHHLGTDQVLRRNYVVQIKRERLLEDMPLGLPVLLGNDTSSS